MNQQCPESGVLGAFTATLLALGLLSMEAGPLLGQRSILGAWVVELGGWGDLVVTVVSW